MPKYYNLPEYDERRRLQQELRQNVDKTIPGYEAYAKAMEELDKKMDAYSELDSHGVARQIDEAGKKELTDAITAAAKAGEAFLTNAKNVQGEGVQNTVDTVRKIQSMMSRDMNLIQQYDPAGPQTKSLPELQNDARSLTVDIGDKAFSKMSGALSERIPMTLQNANGKKVKGFFTKASQFSIKDKFNDILKTSTTLAKDPSFFDDFLGKYRKALTKIEPEAANYSDEVLIGKLIEKTGGGKPLYLKNHFLEIFPRAELKKPGANSLEFLAKGLENLSKTPLSHLNTMIGMKDGQRIDTRNSAMSAVADLLGTPHLIARSRNMKFRDSQGNIVEGTFMDAAKGTDLNNVKSPNAAKVGEKPFSGAGKEGLRQLCDLQVLDYLCGNIDRHAGNILYEFNEKGELIGVQGIDNDSSFSTLSPKDKNLNGLMVAPADMRVISASMAKRVKETDPAMLKFTLRGRGLSEEELDAAVERLTNMKEAIKEGETHYKTHKKPDKNHLLVLPDDQFHRLDISYMRREGGMNTSTINEVRLRMKETYQHRQAVEQGLAQYDKGGTLDLKEFDTTERELLWSAVKKKVGATKQFVENVTLYNGRKIFDSVDDLTNKSHGGSPQFAEMVKAVKELNTYNNGVFRRDDREDQLLSSQEYQKTAYLTQQMGKTADTYLAMKMKEKGVTDLKDLVGKNDYEKDRIEYAKRVKAYAAKHTVADPTREQEQILKENDERSLIDFNKKMAEEAKKLQKQGENNGPALGM